MDGVVARLSFWNVIVVFALIILVYRAFQWFRCRHDPVTLTVEVGLAFCVLGAVSKQPQLISVWIDALLGANAAWVVADAFYIIGLTLLTLWADLMAFPGRLKMRWYLRWRVLILLLVLAWMGWVPLMVGSLWGQLERAGIQVNGSWLVLSQRLVYFGYAVYALFYLARLAKQRMQYLHDRGEYIHVQMARIMVILVALSPILQAVGGIISMVSPLVAEAIWPWLWVCLSAIQVSGAVLILSTVTPLYKYVTKADYAWHAWRLGRLVARHDTTMEPVNRCDSNGQVARIISLLEMEKGLRCQRGTEIEAPAGRIMPTEVWGALLADREFFSTGSSTEQCELTLPVVKGDNHRLVLWYLAALS